MNEGLSLNLLLNGATLLGVAGLAVKVWMAQRGQRITPQPLLVKGAPEAVAVKLCDERHKMIEADNMNLFARMSAAEQRVATLEAQFREIKEQYQSIDGKLTKLLRR